MVLLEFLLPVCVSYNLNITTISQLDFVYNEQL